MVARLRNHHNSSISLSLSCSFFLPLWCWLVAPQASIRHFLSLFFSFLSFSLLLLDTHTQSVPISFLVWHHHHHGGLAYLGFQCRLHPTSRFNSGPLYSERRGNAKCREGFMRLRNLAPDTGRRKSGIFLKIVCLAFLATPSLLSGFESGI